MKLRNLSLLFILFPFVCCSEIVSKKRNNETVLIFENRKNDYSTYKNFKFTGGILRLTPFEKNENSFDLTETMSDTMTIHTEGEGYKVAHRYNLFNSINFPIYKGDTVVITKADSFPFLCVKNRITKPYDVNYNYFKTKRYGLIDGYILNNFDDYKAFLVIMPNLYKKKYDSDSLMQILMFRLVDERNWLDSLKSENLISKKEYTFYKERNMFEILRINNLENRYKTKEDFRELLSEYNDSIYLNDKFNYYREYYQKLADKYYMDKTINLPNARIDDCKYAFDKMEGEDLVTGDLRQTKMMDWLPEIVKNYPVNVGKAYYKKVIAAISDTVLLKRLKSEYSAVFDEKLLNSKKLELLDKYGERLTFENLFERNVGKVIYVDFWASWCEPCLREMSPAAKLREKYADKNVVFIYLTMDNNKEDWMKGIKNAKLGEVRDNYFILNLKTSPLIKNLKINSIPRHLIYNKKGKLIYAEAPSPGSESIYEVLDKYLKE